MRALERVNKNCESGLSTATLWYVRSSLPFTSLLIVLAAIDLDASLFAVYNTGK